MDFLSERVAVNVAKPIFQNSLNHNKIKGYLKDSSDLEKELRTHNLEPMWGSAEACVCCGKLIT